jgi:hypothetical protein
MATNSSKYKLTGVNGSEIQISLNGPTGPTGPANVLEIGDVTTAETGVPAAASITGSSPSQLLHLTLPKGATGTAATIAVGTTATGEAGSSASVTNGGSSSAAVFNFTIPKGDKGNTGTLSLGTFATGNAGTDVIITNTGTPEAGEFNFTIPRGNTGATGTAATIAVGATSTGAAGSSALVTNVGTSSAAVFDFTIPRGNTGATGTAATIAVGTTTTGAAGSSALVTNVGTSSAAVFDFTIPQGLQGIQGIQGETGSSGATALLTGYVSGAGTVAATDTVIQAVGKLNGNDELKASIASLYPYIGGKLLTYTDEEAAIADPLISAGDIYRKTAGGVDYINPDNVPSLDLRFAADKTLTARRGPTPAFTRGSTGTFVGSDGLIQSAAINTPRFDHDPVTLACKGLLIEEGRTNLVTQSGNASSWPNTNGTVTNNGSTTAPDGSSNGFLGGIGTASLVTPATSSVTGLHTASVFLKRNNTDWARVQVAQGSFAHAVNFWVNLATGAAGTLKVAVGTPTSLSAQVTPFGNSWYRVSITASYPATDSLTLSVISATADNSTTRVSGSVYEVWGGQIEVGSFPTSYIPTTTGTLARSADVCNITGGNFNNFYNQSEGTLFLNAVPPFESQLAYPLMVNTTGINQANYISRSNEFGAGSKRWRAITTTSSGIEAVISTSGDITTTNVKAAYAFKLNDNAFAVNNVLVGTDTTVTMPNPTSMRIGGNDGANVLNGHITAVRFYKKRLPNAKLAQLTA